jgi:hypothetical protein
MLKICLCILSLSLRVHYLRREGRRRMKPGRMNLANAHVVSKRLNDSVQLSLQQREITSCGALLLLVCFVALQELVHFWSQLISANLHLLSIKINNFSNTVSTPRSCDLILNRADMNYPSLPLSMSHHMACGELTTRHVMRHVQS